MYWRKNNIRAGVPVEKSAFLIIYKRDEIRTTWNWRLEGHSVTGYCSLSLTDSAYWILIVPSLVQYVLGIILFHVVSEWAEAARLCCSEMKVGHVTSSGPLERQLEKINYYIISKLAIFEGGKRLREHESEGPMLCLKKFCLVGIARATRIREVKIYRPQDTVVRT